MKIARLTTYLSKQKIGVRSFASRPQSNQDWFLFPREQEGNIYSHNWSLVHDGISPENEAFRNARVELLATKLPSKVVDGKIDINTISYTGKVEVKEAGDNISQDSFGAMLEKFQEYLGSRSSVYVEDAAVIADNNSRIGVRIVSDNPAVAIIARSLLIPTPPREVIPLARFDGWKNDKRYSHSEYVDLKWTGSNYTVNLKPVDAGKGQRPIVAYVGAPGNDVAVQYVEMGGKVVGANIVVGASAPISALVTVIGDAACVVSNDLNPSTLALNSVSYVKGDKSAVVVGGNDSVIQHAVETNMRYGLYHNLISTAGVSAFWNGSISSKIVAGSLPAIVSQGKNVEVLSPDNMTHPMATLAFYQEGASKGSITEDDAVARLVKLTDEKKSETIKSLLKGVKCYTVGKTQDIASLL